MTQYFNISKLITELQKRNTLSLRELASKVNISHTTITHWANSLHLPKNKKNLQKLADYCGKSLADLEAYLDGITPLKEFISFNENAYPVNGIIQTLPHYSNADLASLLNAIGNEMIFRLESDRN